MSSKDPRLGPVTVVYGEPHKASCAFCLNPMRLPARQIGRVKITPIPSMPFSSSKFMAPPKEGRNHYALYMPEMHSLCADVQGLWASQYGLSQALRFGHVRRTRKAKKQLESLVDRYYDKYVEWYEWISETFGEEAARKLEGR